MSSVAPVRGNNLRSKIVDEKDSSQGDVASDSLRENGNVDQVEADACRIAEVETWRVDSFIDSLERQIQLKSQKKSIFEMRFANPKHFTWIVVAFASMGGLLFGLDQSLISGASLFYPDALGFDREQVALISASLPLGAVGGAILLIPSNECMGRRKAIILSTVFYTIGAALQAGATTYGCMISGRVIMGLGVGIETGTVPVYVAETIERRLRGNVVSLYQFNIALGEVLGYVVAAIFLKIEGNWRYILGSSVLFSTIMFLGMLFLPESPRFLMHKKEALEAYRVWKRIRDTSSTEAKAEFFVMRQVVDLETRSIESRKSASRFVWLDFFTWVTEKLGFPNVFAKSSPREPRARRAIIYANLMILLGQFVGINGIMYYMGTLMKQVGLNDANSTYMSMVGGGALFIGTIPAVLYMERFGRRFWALAMMPGFFVGLAIIGGSYLVDLRTAPKTVEGMYLAGLITYMLFYGPYACLTWVVPSEVYPTYLRSYGMATSDGMVFLGSFIITYNFTSMQDAMTKTGLSLGFFGGIAVLGWFYQLLFMPETKNMTLEEINGVFSTPTREIVRRNWNNTLRTLGLLDSRS